jgi:hypothetical protein
MMSKTLKIGLLILLAAVLGFSRESVFLHLNGQIKILEFGYDQVSFPFWLRFLETCTYDTLLVLKWVFTTLYFLLFWAFSLLVVRIFFNQKQNYFICHYLYAVAFFLGFFALMLGKIVPEIEETCYRFSRMVMGGGQSPLFTMILIPFFWLRRLS